MPLIQLDLSEDETNRVDALATKQFRTRRSQVMALLHAALPIAEAEQAAAEKIAADHAIQTPTPDDK